MVINNKYTVELVNILLLINKYITPELQRLLDKDHINNMVEDQIYEYNRSGFFSILQSFTIAYVENEKKTYLLDGQHRLAMFSILQDKNYIIHNFIVPLVTYNVDNYLDVEYFFNKINKHSPIQPIGNIIKYDRDLAKLILDEFTTLYIRDGEGNRNCPHISYVQLMNNIKYRKFEEKLESTNKSIIDIFNVIIDINNYLDKSSKYINNYDDRKKYDKCKKKVSNMDNKKICYLGIFDHFEWLDLTLYALIENKEIDNIASEFLSSLDEKKKSFKKRDNIPLELKERIWKKQSKNFCKDGMLYNGFCYTCDTELSYSNMQCGHIIAHAFGGKASFDNLMPICRDCNGKMGTMNLEEYKKILNN
tara:strand:+ start:268 stop:1356 length:1089 start_codon:yes stop_codon:yes gene_type:complete